MPKLNVRITIISMYYLGAVHKLRLQEEGGRWSKRLTFCKLLYHTKCKRRGVGGQKKTNLVTVVFERPLREGNINCLMEQL